MVKYCKLDSKNCDYYFIDDNDNCNNRIVFDRNHYHYDRCYSKCYENNNQNYCKNCKKDYYPNCNCNNNYEDHDDDYTLIICYKKKRFYNC